MSDHSPLLEEEVLHEVGRTYRRFADNEARGRSLLYEALARHVADDGEILRFLLTLPRVKRQPNLLFAAVRLLRGTPVDAADFRRRLFSDAGEVRDLMLRRATQTNEPARCAVLLPALAALPQPLALLEVGASAGLCLLLDRYGYDYGASQLSPERRPCLRCVASPATPLPGSLPQIVWRAGLDHNPLAASDPQDRAWLQALVWPEQTERLERLGQALAVVGQATLRIAQGDLRRDLARLAADAPSEATLVIFHTAVLAYVTSMEERQAFARQATELADFWIANEAPFVFPEIAGRATSKGDGFLLSINGKPTAWTDPHGGSIDWIG